VGFQSRVPGISAETHLSNDFSEVERAQQADAVKLFLKFLQQKGKPYTPIVDRIRTRAVQPTTVDALREALIESLTHW